MENLICIASANALASIKETKNGGWKEIDEGNWIKIKICIDACKNEHYVYGSTFYKDMPLFKLKIDQNFQIDNSAPRATKWKVKKFTYSLIFETKRDQKEIRKVVTGIIQQMNVDAKKCFEQIGVPKICVTRVPSDEKVGATFSSLNSPSICSSSSLFEVRRHPFKGADLDDTLNTDIGHRRICKRCNVSSSLPCLEALKDNLPCPPISPKKRISRMRARVKKNRKQCVNCGTIYLESANVKGSCSQGTDCFGNFVEGVSCICCGRGLMYHCFSGSERDEEPEPFSCKGAKVPYRWLALSLLSLIVPCLCLYLPLKACHNAGKLCGICGARHTDEE